MEVEQEEKDTTISVEKELKAELLKSTSAVWPATKRLGQYYVYHLWILHWKKRKLINNLLLFDL